LEKLSTPNIIVENNNEWIELSSTSLRFWDKIGVLPYSGKKNISWFALCPTMKEYNGEPNINSDLINIVREWIQSLSYIYEVCFISLYIYIIYYININININL